MKISSFGKSVKWLGALNKFQITCEPGDAHTHYICQNFFFYF